MDIALLAAEGDFSSLPDISLAEDDTLTIGRKVYVAGYPYGMPFTITEGSVSSPKQLMDGKYYIQTDAAVNPGNSGGPILDEDNRVVGVTVSKFTQADNMGFGIRVETLHALLDTIGDLDRTVFQVQCGSCEELIAEEEEYCPSCGDKLPEGVFEEREQSPLGGFVESAIEQMGVNPVLARDGYDSWLFHKGSSEIRIFVYDNSYLFSTSPINLLPKKEVEPVLDYMLSEDFGPYKLGIEGRQIYIAYRIHLSDITDESEEEIRKNIVDLAFRADAMDNMLVERFGANSRSIRRRTRSRRHPPRQGDAGLPVKPGIVYSGIAQTGATGSGKGTGSVSGITTAGNGHRAGKTTRPGRHRAACGRYPAVRHYTDRPPAIGTTPRQSRSGGYRKSSFSSSQKSLGRSPLSGQQAPMAVESRA